MMDKIKVRGLLKDDVDEFRVIFLWMKTENVTGNAIYVIEQSRWCRLCYSSGTYK